MSRFTLISILALLSGSPSPAAEAHPQPRPNILFILVDDLNDWIGALNGHPNAITPNIDRLAARGTLFTNAHAAAPLCGPTRAALLSGLRPSTSGIYGHNNLTVLDENPEIRKTTLLPRYFAKYGYKTLSTGKIFHEGSPARAFDEVGLARTDFGPLPAKRLAYTPPGGARTSTDWGAFPDRDEQMPDAVSTRWAVEQVAMAHAKPFLLCVGFIRPHVPWYVPQKWLDLHPLEKISLPPHRDDDLDDLPETARRFSHLPMMPTTEWMRQEQRWEKSVQAYLACISFVDHHIGIILDALAASPNAANTTIVLASDHGYHLGEKGIWAKHTLWERSTRIPLIIARPGDSSARRTARPANHLDIYPTLAELDAAGFPASVTTHGYGNRSVRGDRWRYIRYADGAEELYDHAKDPNEWQNLAAPEMRPQPVIEELRRHLPAKDTRWIPSTRAGSDYNDYFSELFERTRADRPVSE